MNSRRLMGFPQSTAGQTVPHLGPLLLCVTANLAALLPDWVVCHERAVCVPAVPNCTNDEGGPFGFGDQVADPKPPRAAAVKSLGGERRGNVGTMIPAGMVERGERKRTASEASKAD